MTVPVPERVFSKPPTRRSLQLLEMLIGESISTGGLPATAALSKTAGRCMGVTPLGVLSTL